MPFNLFRIASVAIGITFVLAIIIIVFKAIFSQVSNNGLELSLFGDFLG